jgi:hypothetical protein
MPAETQNPSDEKIYDVTLRAVPQINIRPNGNSVVMLEFSPNGRDESYSGTFGGNSGTEDTALVKRLSTMKEGNSLQLRGTWSKAEWQENGTPAALYHLNISKISEGEPEQTQKLSLGLLASRFLAGYRRHQGVEVDNTIEPTGRPKLVDTRAPDYDPIPNRRYGPPPAENKARRASHDGDDLPNSTLTGTLSGPVYMSRASSGNVIGQLYVTQDGKGTKTKAAIVLPKDNPDPELQSYLTKLQRGDRVTLKGLWNIGDAGRDFRIKTINPAEPIDPSMTQEPKQDDHSRPPREARKPTLPETTTLLAGTVIEPAVPQDDGRHLIIVRDPRNWTNPTRVLVDTETLRMPQEVVSALTTLPVDSSLVIRGGWQRRNKTDYSLVATHVTSPAIQRAWMEAGLKEPDKPLVKQKAPRGLDGTKPNINTPRGNLGNQGIE